MNYPKDIKAFYMRVNDDGKTVAAMDVLAPGIGEIIGGSQREERLDVLDARMTERAIDKEHYGWYRDLRRYGTVPHAGFGLGFERTLAYVTGLSNVRDAIPFPRTPGNARYCETYELTHSPCRRAGDDRLRLEGTIDTRISALGEMMTLAGRGSARRRSPPLSGYPLRKVHDARSPGRLKQRPGSHGKSTIETAGRMRRQRRLRGIA